ncbi:acetylxylan esterase [Lacihabitans sp. CCS-44]|uniref:acetylxylan esterase n=1 Tax=Lacihabitans sp. CCS-44 TaxID=2487331 RepID=UPI0020CD1449|nr:acetylxylan esterase [Lacihabitans sp. CCS-44]MCP9755797.1 acetylxylan esterase [Lacihabitans sp. CCS-44]
MNKIRKSLHPVLAFFTLFSLQFFVNTATGQPPGFQRPPLPPIPIKGDTTHTLSRHFSTATNTKIAPYTNGFVHRWLVLEPIKKDIARNNIFTDNYLRNTFQTDNFLDNYLVVPKDGEMVKVGNQDLKWYGLDSKTFNFNLFNFSYDINKPKYGLLFWLVTVIDCPEEIQNVRMTAGCNSGGMFWLNGKEVLMLSGDRDMIVDNVASPLLTLKKGKNIIRGAVINGPGMANFCLRFIDEKGKPVKSISISKN